MHNIESIIFALYEREMDSVCKNINFGKVSKDLNQKAKIYDGIWIDKPIQSLVIGGISRGDIMVDTTM